MAVGVETGRTDAVDTAFGSAAGIGWTTCSQWCRLGTGASGAVALETVGRPFAQAG